MVKKYLISTIAFVSMMSCFIRADQQAEITGPVVVAYESCNYFQFPVKPTSDEDYSGYHALYNGHVSLKMHDANEKAISGAIDKLKNDKKGETLFADELSAWPSHVVRERKKLITLDAITDHLTSHIARCHKVPLSKTITPESISHEYIFTLLRMEKAAVAFDKGLDDSYRTQVASLIKIIPGAARRCVEAATQQLSGSYPIQLTITGAELRNALKEEAKDKENVPSMSLIQEQLDTYFPKLGSLSLTLSYQDAGYALTCNGQELFFQKGQYCSRSEAPQKKSTSREGGLLDVYELRMLAIDQSKTPSPDFAGLTSGSTPLCFLTYSETETLEESIFNLPDLNWLEKVLAKNPTKLAALFLIRRIDSWISCVISKDGKDISLIVTDSKNQDRQNDIGIVKLIDTIRVALTKKNAAPKKDKPSRVDGGVEAPEEEKINYDAPLAQVPDDQLASLEEIFGDPLPNSIKVRMKQLEQREGTTKQHTRTKLKNRFLLYGPPGTGKSTAAQVMARKAGRNVLFAGGGDFRTAYQGSGKAKIDALFAEAKKHLPCVVIIDEIDAAASQMTPHGSTQEDNRGIKSLITALDQLENEPGIVVIGTTNYPDKMDPAVLRRFIPIEVPLPDLEKREQIIKKYFTENDITIEAGNENAVTPDFFDLLVSATKGFSGEALSNMINNAAYESKMGLEPEHDISVGFRFNGVNASERTMFSNLVEVMALPLIPLYHMVGESKMDKHLYSHYRKQVDLQNTIKEREKQDDYRNVHAKDPRWKRVLYQGVEVINVASILYKGAQLGLKGWDYLKSNTRVGEWLPNKDKANTKPNPFAGLQPGNDLDDSVDI